MARKKQPETPKFDYGEYRLLGKIVHQYEPWAVYERWEFLDWDGVVIEAKNEAEAKERVEQMFGGEQK